MSETLTRFRVGDLGTVQGQPPASGEVIATCPSVGKVRVQFRGLACWLDEAHLELLASGDARPASAPVPLRGEGERG